MAIQSPRFQPLSTQPPRRVLIIRPSALGDVCRTVPVLVSLKTAYPDASIDWVVQDSFVDAVSAHPCLSRAVAFPRHASLVSVLRWIGGLRSNRYDMVIDCQGLARSGLFAWCTRAPIRIGDRDARELAWLGYNRRVRTDPERHTVDRMLALLSAVPAEAVLDMRLYVPPEATWEPAVPEGTYAVIAPTSRWPGKRWPEERFARVAEALLERVERVVLVGTTEERDQCPALIRLAGQEARIVDRIGGTSVRGLMALVKRAAIVIANDSAALHMAVGFDRPMVGLYGPTDVKLVGPYGRERDVIQHVKPGDRLDHKDAALGHALMMRIPVEEVIEAALARLATRASARTPA